MTLSLISEPLKTQGTIVDSPVLASKAQARYEFLRQDFVETTDLINVADSGGFVQITTVAAASTLVSVNDNVYFNADSVYDGVGSVTTVNANDFITTIPFVSALTPIVNGRLNNLTSRPNHRIRFDITDDDTSVALLSNLFFAAKENGVLIVDLQESFVFSNDLLKTRQLKIVATEVWTGATGTVLNLTVIQSILAFLQIQSVRGSNLVDHLLALKAVGLKGVQDETGTTDLLAAGVVVGDGGPPSDLINVASLIP